MKERLLVLALLSATCLAMPAPSLQAQESDDTLAAAFYPPDFRADEEGHGSVRESIDWSTVRADLDGVGSQTYLIVAYTNGFSGRLRVIKADVGAPTLVADPQQLLMGEQSPSLQIADFDGDSRPEIIVTFLNGRRRTPFAWVFKWDGRDLKCLNPQDRASLGDLREIVDPTFVDLDGDGRMEVLEPTATFGVDREFESPEESVPLVPDQSYDVLSLGREAFVETGNPLTYFGYFERHSAKPTVATQQFKASSGRYVLRVINGIAGGDTLASGVIAINGRVVLSPSDFKSNVPVMEKEVSLAETNSISAELRSAPGSAVSVAIRKVKN